MSLVYRQEFQVPSYLVSSKKRLNLVGLLSLLQETGGNHADHLGLGYEHMVATKSFWVLVRQIVDMKKWPRWNDTISIRTWPRALDELTASRDFEIFVGDEKYGGCSTDYMVLDAETRKPKRPDYKGLQFPADHPAPVDLVNRRIGFQKDLQILRELQVLNGDLDMNQHVNNTKYSQWVIDSIPHDIYSAMTLDQYEINFISEARIGDRIQIQYAPLEPEGAASHFQGVRMSDGKPIFTAVTRGSATMPS